MTTTRTDKKTADVREHVDGQATTYLEDTLNEHTAPQTYEVRLEDRGQSNGLTFATYAGDRLPMKEYRRVIVPWELILDAHHNGAVTVTVSAADIAEHDRLIYADRADRERREHDARLLAEAKAREIADAEDLLHNLDPTSLTSL